MVPKQAYAESSPDSEYSFIYTPSTISPSLPPIPEESNVSQSPLNSSIPKPGSAFIIRSAKTGHAITFQQGRIVLIPPVGPTTTRWQCVQNKGWLGFRDLSSGMFLGYDENEELCCTVRQQELWENFCVRHGEGDGYLMLMTHYRNWCTIFWNELRPVGIRVKRNEEVPGVVEDWEDEGVLWQFVRV